MKIREVFFPACLNIPVSESKRQWGKDPRNLGLNFSASTTWGNCSWPQGRHRRQSQALKWLQNWLLLLRMQGQVKSKANNFKNQAFSSLSIVFSQAVFSLSFKQENAFCLVRKAERLIYSDHAQDTWECVCSCCWEDELRCSWVLEGWPLPTEGISKRNKASPFWLAPRELWMDLLKKVPNNNSKIRSEFSPEYKRKEIMLRS